MSVENFIRAMPKAELNVRLEGAVRKATWVTIAEQNEIPAEQKQFDSWIRLLDKPNYAQLDDLIQAMTEWLLYPDDLTRIVYDVGVSLHKRNVRYAEVSVDLTLFLLSGLPFNEFMDALNDGRDRAERGWGIRMGWILAIPRSQPRRLDEALRWATSTTGKRNHVVALGLVGHEDAQPVGQFERAFGAAQKKEVPRVVQAGDVLGAEGVREALEYLKPSRIVDGRGVTDSPEVLQTLVDQEIPLIVSVKRAVCHDWVKSHHAYPLRDLYDAGVKLTLSADMPNIYRATLTDEYLAAIKQCKLSLGELEELALNAVRFSFLPDEEKSVLLAEFEETYDWLRAEHQVNEMDEAE